MKPTFKHDRTITVIDWSAITMNRAHSLFSNELPITRPTEISEIRYRIARKLYPFLRSLDSHMVIFAIDNKVENERNYWRCDYLYNYYRENHSVHYSKSEDTHYYHFDNGYHTLEEDGFSKKLAKKNIPKDLEEVKFAVADPDLFPSYKGNRSNLSWNFEMPKEVYQEEMNKLLLELAGTIPNSRIVDVFGAEADDIAGVLACKGAPVNHVLYTHDGDWTQLQSENTHIYNLPLEQYLAPIDTEEFIETKIIQGDSGDGISSTWIHGKATDIRGKDCNLGEKGAKTIWKNKETHLINPEVYKRNRDLIQLSLDTIPKDIQDKVVEAVKTKVDYPEYTWEHYTLSKTERELLWKEWNSSILTRKKTPPVPVGLEEKC